MINDQSWVSENILPIAKAISIHQWWWMIANGVTLMPFRSLDQALPHHGTQFLFFRTFLEPGIPVSRNSPTGSHWATIAGSPLGKMIVDWKPLMADHGWPWLSHRRPFSAGRVLGQLSEVDLQTDARRPPVINQKHQPINSFARYFKHQEIRSTNCCH